MTTRPLVTALAAACFMTTLAAACAEPRSHTDHRDELFTFATVLAVGRVAPARCPGVTADASGVWELPQGHAAGRHEPRIKPVQYVLEPSIEDQACH